MKLSFAFLVLVWISEISSLTSQITLLQNHSSRINNGVYDQPKMIENRNIFSPRMDYEEWTPLGRGDPLKNDPTYDYVPPVLERVHYWMDPSKRTPDPPLPNSGVLVLGSRTESTFTTRPTTPRYQPFQSKESQADSRIDTSSLLDPFFKLIDVSQFNLNFNSNANYHYKPLPNRIQRPHFQNPKHKTQPQPPMQRPQPPQALQRPPYTMLMPPPPPPPPTQSVTNLITSQATTVPDKAPTQITTVSVPSTSNLPLTTKNTTTINPTVLANTENMFKPVAISMPGTVEPVEGETLNEIKPTAEQPAKKTTERPTTDPVLPIVTMFENHKKEFDDEFKQKQQQTNSNHLQHQTTIKYKILPKVPPQSEKHNEVIMRTREPDSAFIRNRPHWGNENNLRATTAPTFTTTKVNTLTTDSMFKHYKQPSEPIKGPFYLIIQGHSKVKTYGASKNPVNSLLTSNEIKYDEEDNKKKISGKYERKARKLKYDVLGEENLKENNKVEDFENQEKRSFDLIEENNFESLEDTFPKSNGGRSKKRYLGSNHRRKRFVNDVYSKRRLLSEESEDEESQAESREKPEKPENLDLESLIAISDDYDPEDVANILLKNDESPGSGLGGLALSLFSRTDPNGQEV